MNMKFIRKLPIPQEIKKEYPVSEELAAVKAGRDEEIRRIFFGGSDKFILVIGPCSADRREPVLEYIGRLKRVYDEVSGKLMIIPRIYTNKPRTAGVGYMGMLHRPNPEGEPDLLHGLIAIRDIHLTALADYGFTCADELLYPDNYRYLSDLLSYVAVGARSVENQYHRLAASGLDVPVGMKNPISGDLSVMFNSVNAARQSHAFLYRGWEVVTEGNPLAHGVLRGFKDGDGRDVPNYGYGNLCTAIDMMKGRDDFSCALLVDTNHSNSGKNADKQAEVALDVLESRRKNADVRRAVKGLMIESYLEDGAGDIGSARPGLSITDPCLGWKKTRDLIYRIADRV
ncbi:MAG: 3-deoxy-7-phosphoheptulonate synthase [Clostridia bacterium]|nr:3-deoxy-7-phosphoheptulonate synthase [Clostridia bacterium]